MRETATAKRRKEIGKERPKRAANVKQSERATGH